jgi:hypothetical protein
MPKDKRHKEQKSFIELMLNDIRDARSKLDEAESILLYRLGHADTAPETFKTITALSVGELALMMELSKGGVRSYDRLQDALYGDRLPQDYPYSARKVVQQHIFGLRKKGYSIRVHHNYGYELLPEEASPAPQQERRNGRAATRQERLERRRAMHLN